MTLTLIGALSEAALAATLCVNPGGTGGCYPTINTAVAAASPGDTIQVAPGTYAEDVVIGKPLSLVGAGASNTVIDATGLSAGIYIDGIDYPGLTGVIITGFRVENSNFEGILVANSSLVTIANNSVLYNNRSLNATNATCPGEQDFETAEGFDCGEGIHLTGVDHSTVANNTVANNSGGILLSDDTGSTHHNLITGNTVLNNPYDCGITLASHPPAALTGASSPLGVHHNTIAANTSSHNGLQVPGAGAGVGMFTFLPGGTVTGNLVIANYLIGNGLPGVAVHGHSPGENLNDNEIVGNHISGNGADTADAATPGPTGINLFAVSPLTNTVVSQNVIQGETDDIVVNNPAGIEVHLNEFRDPVGIVNLGTGPVDATENWWLCAGGPGAAGCASVSGTGVSWTPWLTGPFLPRRF